MKLHLPRAPHVTLGHRVPCSDAGHSEQTCLAITPEASEPRTKDLSGSSFLSLSTSASSVTLLPAQQKRA